MRNCDDAMILDVCVLFVVKIISAVLKVKMCLAVLISSSVDLYSHYSAAAIGCSYCDES